jgi:uncharacterized membrane protein YidH (DUF202 family)
VDDRPARPRAGSAAERTQLAWGRSALSLIGCGLAVTKGIPGVTDDGRPVYGLLMVGLGGVVWLAASPWRALPWRGRVLRPRGMAQLTITAAGTAIVATAALIIASISAP